MSWSRVGASSESIMSEIGTAKSSIEEYSVNENCYSQNSMPDTTNAENIGHETRLSDNSASVRRPKTKRGRNGKKWVGVNWENKEQLKRANNGSMPYSEALITSPFPHSDKWSEDQLPEILFYIKPPKSEFEGQPVSFLQENGEVVKVGKYGKPMRDFPILPHRISLEVPGWLVETWRRLDPRITYPDILDRQIEDPIQRLKKLDKNALQNHCRRECRMILGMWTNYERREVPHRTDVEAIECLSYQNVMLNTILNVCPDRQDRLTKVRLTKRSQDGCGKYYAEPYEVNETNLYQTTFPIDRFVLKSEAGPNGLHPMDRSMLAAWELSLILQERARHHGVNHWRKLGDSCRPISWFDRTVKKRRENQTFDGGCSVCTWVLGKDQGLHKDWIDDIKSASSRKPSLSLIKDSSSSTSKRRKLKDGTKQNTSTKSANRPAEECDCCKEMESYKSWSKSEKYPSERFLRGEIRSYSRDMDRVEACVDTMINNSMKHGVFEQEGEHGPIEYETEHSVEAGIEDNVAVEGWETSLSNSFCTLPASEQKSDPILPTFLERGNIDPALFGMSRVEIDLNGIGGHLIMNKEGYLPHYERDEATEMSVEDNYTYDGRSASSMNDHLRENIDEKWVSPEYFNALWNVRDGSVRSPKLEKPIVQYPTDSDAVAGSYLQMQLEPSEDSPFWYQSGSHQFINARRAQSEPPPIENQGPSQNLGYSDWSHLPHPPSSSDMPGLATSFQTESGSFSSDPPGQDLFGQTHHSKSTEVERPASVFKANIVGLSTFNDTTACSGSRTKGGDFSRQLSSAFATDDFFDSKAWQTRFEPAGHPDANNVSGRAMHERDGDFIASPTAKHYNDDDLYEDGLSAIDESISDFY